MRQKETTSVVSVTRVLQRNDTYRNMNSLTRRRDPFSAVLVGSSTSKSTGKMSIILVLSFHRDRSVCVKGFLVMLENYHEGHTCCG